MARRGSLRPVLRLETFAGSLSGEAAQHAWPEQVAADDDARSAPLGSDAARHASRQRAGYTVGRERTENRRREDDGARWTKLAQAMTLRQRACAQHGARRSSDDQRRRDAIAAPPVRPIRRMALRRRARQRCTAAQTPTRRRRARPMPGEVIDRWGGQAAPRGTSTRDAWPWAASRGPPSSLARGTLSAVRRAATSAPPAAPDCGCEPSLRIADPAFADAPVDMAWWDSVAWDDMLSLSIHGRG